MSRTDLNKLDYPMFKVTLNEATLLTLADKQLRAGTSSFLCTCIQHAGRNYRFPDKQINDLRSKVNAAIRGQLTLDYELCKRNLLRSCSDFPAYKIRRIWIRKLLKFNGYGG